MIQNGPPQSTTRRCCLWLRARLYAGLEQWSQVLADADRYVTLGGVDLSYWQAEALAHLGREADALSTLDKSIRESPEDVWGYLNRADILFCLGRLDDALEATENALDVDPKEAWAHLYRADYSLHRPGSCARADADLTRALELRPTDLNIKRFEAEIRVLLGLTCPELAAPARSLEMAQEAAKFRPRSFSYQRSLGIALYADARYEDAKATLLGALDLKPKPDPMTLFFLAMTESKLGRQADARRTYDRAVARMNETWPKSPDLVMLKAEAVRLLDRSFRGEG